MKCPRRRDVEVLPTGLPDLDEWDTRTGRRVCSFCGSLHPEDFFGLVAGGADVVPRDSDVECGVGVAGQLHTFNYRHLTMEGRVRFAALYNVGRLGLESDFTVDPYFLGFGPEPSAEVSQHG